MSEHPAQEVPFRSKLVMLEDLVETLRYLHMGNRKGTDRLIDDLKLRSTFLEEKIQQAVLMFAEQVHFQFDYDPWHKITPEVGKMANQLIEELGFELRDLEFL